MPNKKKKFNARFPPARIKKIMQKDEEVGKVAAAVPVIISRSLELFIESLIKKTNELTASRNAKTLTTQHIKQTILSEKKFDFLKDLIENIPDVQPNEEDTDSNGAEQTPRTTKPRGRPRKVKSGDGDEDQPKRRGRKRKAVETKVDEKEKDVDSYDSEETESNDSDATSTDENIPDGDGISKSDQAFPACVSASNSTEQMDQNNSTTKPSDIVNFKTEHWTPGNDTPKTSWYYHGNGSDSGHPSYEPRYSSDATLPLDLKINSGLKTETSEYVRKQYESPMRPDNPCGYVNYPAQARYPDEMLPLPPAHCPPLASNQSFHQHQASLLGFPRPFYQQPMSSTSLSEMYRMANRFAGPSDERSDCGTAAAVRSDCGNAVPPASNHPRMNKLTEHGYNQSSGYPLSTSGLAIHRMPSIPVIPASFHSGPPLAGHFQGPLSRSMSVPQASSTQSLISSATVPEDDYDS